MKKISCVGFHATGAGVIDDLLREFDNVSQGAYEVEARMLQDPDGVSDLEYNLLENPHRLNSGYAVKRFLKYVRMTSRTYHKVFGKKWEEISKEYAERLTKITYPGYWHGDLWLLSPVWRGYFLYRRALAKMSPKPIRKPPYYNYFPWLKTRHVCIGEEEFLEATRDYVDALCETMNRDHREFVLLDQVLSPSNPARYFRYVRDLKVVIVNRDPRDVYIYLKHVKDHVLPQTPEEFCAVFRDTHKIQSEVSPDLCMQVQFEDMIYKYDEYVPKVMEFIGVTEEHHTRKKTRFNPEISIKNTRLWERYPQYAKEAEIIAKLLPEYLYPYEDMDVAYKTAGATDRTVSGALGVNP
jgi:hypothetical protein